MAGSEYEQGRKDWAKTGRLDVKKIGSRDYRKGAQDQRTEQVDAELRQLKGGRR